MKTKILLLAAAFALPFFTMANNIRVVLNSFNPTTKQLKISLAWDNSWHDGSGQFRDAAWLFIKYKDITNNEWQHAILANPSTANNILTDTLSGSGVKFDVLGRNPSVAPGPVGSRGYMIRRQKGATTTVQNNPQFAGVYNVGMPLTATLVLPAGVVLANPEFRVYALEMVNVPAGSFYAGDGTSASMVKTSDSNNSPFLLTSETAAITPYINGNPVAIPAGTSTAPTYPRGVNEFFIMKYELSLDGYHEYLNTLTRTQQNSQLATSPTEVSGSFDYGFSTATYTSQTNPAVFSCDANHNGIFNEANDGKTNGVLISYVRAVLGYLDWAAIRPMTGFEFEKACRGPLYPVPNENAWGSAVYNVANLDIDRYGPNETNSLVVDGPGFNGSIRNGAFAKANGSTRLNSGGSYYGVMELSSGGYCLSTGFSEFGWTSFTGTNGDGIVNASYAGMYLRQHYTVSNSNFYWEENFNYSAYGLGYFEIRGVIK